MELYKDAILTRDMPEHGLLAGDVGTDVERHQSEDGIIGYSVEFFDRTGRSVTVVTVHEADLRAPTIEDRSSVRAVA